MYLYKRTGFSFIIQILKLKRFSYRLRKYPYFLNFMNFFFLNPLIGCFSELTKSWLFKDMLFSQDSDTTNVQWPDRIWCIAVDWSTQQ